MPSAITLLTTEKPENHQNSVTDLQGTVAECESWESWANDANLILNPFQLHNGNPLPTYRHTALLQPEALKMRKFSGYTGVEGSR